MSDGQQDIKNNNGKSSWSRILHGFIGYVILFIVALFVINLLIGYAVTEKTWYEKLWSTIVGGSAGAAIGAISGAIIGGIGVAMGGWAIGLLGWLAVGIVGGTLGALGGSVYTILSNPNNYNINYIAICTIFIGGIISGIIGKKLYHFIMTKVFGHR